VTRTAANAGVRWLHPITLVVPRRYLCKEHVHLKSCFYVLLLDNRLNAKIFSDVRCQCFPSKNFQELAKLGFLETMSSGPGREASGAVSVAQARLSHECQHFMSPSRF
jgi:hypothetical protein